MQEKVTTLNWVPHPPSTIISWSGRNSRKYITTF